MPAMNKYAGLCLLLMAGCSSTKPHPVVYSGATNYGAGFQNDYDTENGYAAYYSDPYRFAINPNLTNKPLKHKYEPDRNDIAPYLER
jgi:hypothetical protein